MTTRKRRRRRSHQVTVPDQAIAVSVSALDRLKWWGGVVGAISIIVGTAGVVLGFLGLMPVVDRELKATLTTLKSEVTAHSDKNTIEVKRDVGKTAEQQVLFGKTLAQLQIELLEDRVGRFYALKTEKSMSLSNIESLLAQPATKMDPAQRQNLIARKAEQEAALKWIESEWTAAQERLRQAKLGK